MIDSERNRLAREIADTLDALDTAQLEIVRLREDLGRADTHRALQSVVIEEAKKLRSAIYGDRNIPPNVIASFDEWMKKLRHFEEV